MEKMQVEERKRERSGTRGKNMSTVIKDEKGKGEERIKGERKMGGRDESTARVLKGERKKKRREERKRENKSNQ